MKQAFLLTLLFILPAVYCTSSAEPDLIYNCDVDYPKWGCDPTRLVQGDMWKCSMNTTEMQGRLMSWAKWPLKSDCYDITAGDESSPATSYIPSDAQLPQYLYINIRTVCYGLAFRGLLMYAVNDAGEKVGDWNIPSDPNLRWKQPWGNIPGHECQQALMHASGTVKPYFNRYRFQLPVAGQGKLTFKVLIKQGDANEGAFFYPAKSLQLTEASASLPDPVFVQTAAGQSCSQLCQSKSLACDADALALLNSSVALDKKLVRTVPCNLPFLESTIAESSYADPATGMCYFTRTHSCDVASGNQFCSCASLNANAASGLAPKISTVLAAGALFSLFNKRFAVVALFLVYLIGSSEAHNWLGTVSRSLGASTVAPCKQSRTGSPHVQIGPNQNFSITFFQAHLGITYFTLVALEDVPKLGKLNKVSREKYINESLPQHRVDVTTGQYQKFHLTPWTTDSDEWKNAPLERQIEKTDPLWFSEAALGNKGRASYNKAAYYQSVYKPAEKVGDQWVTYNHPNFTYIKSMWKFRNTAIGKKDMAMFKLPTDLSFGRYVVQYSWGGYYDCVDIDYVNRQVPADKIYGTEPTKATWNRVDHCTVKNPRVVYPKFGPEEVIYDMEKCKARIEPLRPRVSGGAENVQASVVVASNLTAYQAYNFRRYANEANNWTVHDFAYPDFPGSEVIFPIEQNNGWNASVAEAFMKTDNRDKIFCWGAVPPEFTTTTDIYFTTDDPLDPVFYSTCWVLNNENIFEDVPAATEIETTWKYNEQCISCGDKAHITRANTVPVWRLAQDCRNCNLEPAEPSQNYTSLTPAVPFTMVINGSKCDGFTATSTQFEVNPASYPNCSAEEVMGCWKNLFGTNQKFPDSTAGGATLSPQQCATLASKDTDCSNVFMSLTRDNASIKPSAASCVCLSKNPCCQQCRVTRSNQGNAINYAEISIYETKSIADPGCANGVKSSDNVFCCPSTCKTCITANAPSPSPAPVVTQTPRPPLTPAQFDQGYRNVDICKDARVPAFRTCNLYAPPCFI